MMALGDELRADDEVVLAALDLGEALAESGRCEPMSDERITVRASGKRAAASSATRSMPGPMGTSAVVGAALGADLRAALLVAAMVAHEDAAEAVLDQPGIAVGALVLVAAGLAERQRGIAAAVEEQQRLLAAIERREDFAGEARRDPLALLGRLLAHVERGDVGQRCAAKREVSSTCA